MPIERRGLRWAAVVVAVAGFLRLTSPGAQAPRPTESPKKETQAIKRVTSSYLADLERTVHQFFGKERLAEENPEAAWDLPGTDREGIRFVIAILPDPVHTHLGLLFDRGIEAIQQAAQTQGYVFDRAILPWDRSPHQDTDLEKRQKEIEEQRIRESYPGLLLFREGLDRKRKRPGMAHEQPGKELDSEAPLFVLIVGETPTGGLRSLQFTEALKVARLIRGKELVKGQALSIMGPTFSGSLASLDRELNAKPDPKSDSELIRLGVQKSYVFSGTVTDDRSIHCFENQLRQKDGRFVSFQQNDGYLLQRLVDFVRAQSYEVNEIAVLSEETTVYGIGTSNGELNRPDNNAAPHRTSCVGGSGAGLPEPAGLVHLYFPREISFFRSAYQKATAAQPQQDTKTPGRATLALDLEDTGSDDDTVAPYGGSLTPLSQEAVMLGITSELQKHHIKFTVLRATDPADQLFLARYLRTAYPQGRVIITAPDLLFTREEDTLLRGVLGLSSYAMVPGLSDRLCEPCAEQGQDGSHEHSAGLFTSSLTVGAYNAMLGLLALQDSETGFLAWNTCHGATTSQNKESLPVAPYAEYAGLPPKDSCAPSPLSWLTVLGQDGFWPVAPLDATRGDQGATIATGSTLKPAGAATLPADKWLTTPEAWYTAYCLCLLMMVIQGVLSWTGSTLADSESGAQFARNEDAPSAFIICIGALVLSLAFVGLMCARSPLLPWAAPWAAVLWPPVFWTIVLWLPVLLFGAVTLWDLVRLRAQRPAAIVFFSVAVLVSFYLLAFDMPPRSRIYWIPRVVHLASGVSPVVPVLLLLAAGYWWMWQSLRGVALVDLRRPRLPEIADLPKDAYRISDSDGEKLRQTAHPFTFQWQIWIPILLVVPFAATVADLDHPVQTVEGFAYDIGYSLLLFLMLAAFLGCLLKLVRTWFACRHILGGLNRLPLRDAFGRMKNISWHSLWNPGGTTLRETYRLMARALENLGRLRLVLFGKQSAATPAADPPDRLATQIACTMDTLSHVQSVYEQMHPQDRKIVFDDICKTANDMKCKEPELEIGPIRKLKSWERPNAEAERILMVGVESLQKKMAKTAGVVMVDVLKPFWEEERSPVVSEAVNVKESTPSPAKSEEANSSAGKPLAQGLPLARLLGEEYVALIYVNFLVTVLLRMRTMIICAIGLYVFLVLSLNSYPFEPHPALQTLSVVLLVLLGAAVGFVYTEMHRDPILSRLTSSEPGQLGWDFWLKLGSAAAIPVFSLLATQFPQINQLLFSWLKPALEAVK